MQSRRHGFLVLQRREYLLDPLDIIAYFGTFDFVHFILYFIMALLLWSYDFILLFSNIFFKSEQKIINCLHCCFCPTVLSPLRWKLFVVNCLLQLIGTCSNCVASRRTIVSSPGRVNWIELRAGFCGILLNHLITSDSGGTIPDIFRRLQYIYHHYNFVVTIPFVIVTESSFNSRSWWIHRYVALIEVLSLFSVGRV